MKRISLLLLINLLILASCNRKGCTDPLASNFDENAKKHNGKCEYDTLSTTYEIPTTYSFLDANGNNTVNYSGQTDRLNQLREMVVLIDAAKNQTINSPALYDMWSNTGENGNGQFSFSSSKQLKNKCFDLDQSLFESWFDSIATMSQARGNTAVNGQAGLISNGTDTYLVNQYGVEYKQLLEKGIMGAVFMYQALNVYFGDDKMSVDNTTAVDPSADKYYTVMEHHFDEAFGYFGVDTDFPNTIPSDFWGKYSNAQDAQLGANQHMMDNFLKGRAAISNDDMSSRDEAIDEIQMMWEKITAHQAVTYLDQAIGYFGQDNAKFLHVLSEAYAFAWNLRYAPVDTRAFSSSEHQDLMNLFPVNFWDATISNLNEIKNNILEKY